MPPDSAPYSDTLWEEFAEVDVVDVVVDVDAPDLQPFYSYRVPEELRNTLQAGTCVRLPFAGREALGYVLARRRIPLSDPLCRKLKPVHAILPDAVSINEEQIRTVLWMSERYVCDLLSAMRCVAPAVLSNRLQTVVRLQNPDLRGEDAGDSMARAHLIETLRALGGSADLETLRATARLSGFSSAYADLVRAGLFVEAKQVVRPRATGKKVRVYALGPAANTLTGLGRQSPQQQRILDLLVEHTRQGHGGLTREELLARTGASAASLRGLVERGVVVCEERTVWRAPTSISAHRTVPPELTAEQRQATAILRQCIESRSTQTVLLFGVTASGKTEVYLNAIEAVLQQGRTAMVLVPEIALTTQVVDVFVGRFGEQVAVLHSKLSEGERHDEWRRMQDGQARIVVGARSAVFAPLDRLGLIVVDEEHEASYKQENNPRYNAKDLAAERARLSGATLVLGSATPSIETYYASCPEAGDSRIRRIEMRQRIGNRPLPDVHVVDLRAEFRKRPALFSTRLVEAMHARLRCGQQIILFLNRRGYAQFVLCRDCGWVARCPHCAVSLAFHAYDRTLKCHHCEHVERAPMVCPDCGGTRVKAFGIGTEKVEEEVAKIFPEARVARMDRDTTARKGAHGRLMREFREGRARILIGTQMVAKGLDFPNVTLVGVVSADTAINLPDFRAAERTFQLLTQVAGRAGRGESPGEVIIQTFSPDHYAVQAAVHQDYAMFYRTEIQFRQELRYPPFSRFANLVCTDLEEARASGRAQRLAYNLRQVAPDSVEIIGPAPAPLVRLKNQYRHHVALRAPVDAPISGIIREALQQMPPEERRGVSVDIDPLSMI
ncbi:MAG: primosomal protein N' [Chloroherpetonaceae bacterium]|nr:primosomal protein N' [Chthonomonadaceae bacterium]MDW8208460.1 primosomal protein N' [Chloroherpetonaceae bacterium]